MSHYDTWREIVHASGLEDLAAESHGHDLLDGIKKGMHGCPLDKAFYILCRHLGVAGWDGAEEALQRMRTVKGFEGLRLPDHVLDEILDDQMGNPKIGICDHTSVRRGTYSDKWGTPDHIITVVRDLYGPITHDLASSPEDNKRIQASKIWTAWDPCPEDPGMGAGDVVWCNPPGPCHSVKEFWDVWLKCVARGAVGGFLIFKQDHWRQLPAPPMPVLAVVLRKRLRYVGAKGGASFPSTLVLVGVCNLLPQVFDLGHVVVWQDLERRAV